MKRLGPLFRRAVPSPGALIATLANEPPPPSCHPERSEGPAVDSVPTPEPQAGPLPNTLHPRLRHSLNILLICALTALAATLLATNPHPSTALAAAPPASPPTDDATCARCHQAIYSSYERTSMARGSGPVTTTGPSANLIPGKFTHTPSGIDYAVFARDNQAWLSFDRPVPSVQMLDLDHPAPPAASPLHGERRLDYYIGSGKHGRTYLYQVDGAWFELPINYYTRRQAWAMAPAFDLASHMPADLPTDPGCLHCHATGVAQATPGSRSHYPGLPFAQGGIGCSACHGDPTAHLAANGHAPILNPDKLAPARRDSACLQCHLEGDALAFRSGKTLAQFKPGDALADYAVYFVRAGRVGGGGRAASQYEALLRSACKRSAGDRLTCTTCHDPHATPEPADRVAFYRGKCLACHTSPAIARDHHPEQQDCATCHMPTRLTTDISHEQSVDHDIERTPAGSSLTAPRTGEILVPVSNWQASDRELGLAYAQIAARGDRQSGQRALQLLTRAEAAGATDATLHTQLGFLRQMAGQREQARSEYLSALEQNPAEPGALANLAVLDATGNRVPDAIALLERLIARDPAQTSAGLNLAFIECRLGDRDKALTTLAALARYNPDDPSLRTLRTTGNYAGQHCDLAAAPPTTGAASQSHSLSPHL